MQALSLFLPCAAGVEELLAAEVRRLLGTERCAVVRGGVALQASWRDMLCLNLHSRLAQRVLIRLWQGDYRHEQDLYDAAHAVPWELWFTPRESFKIEVTSRLSPLKSLNFAALRIKDAIADRFREKSGSRPDVDTAWPRVRVYVHLGATDATLYIDTSGEPLFKRGWRENKGDAPLKETLAAAMIAASGWDAVTPLYDPCCGSGTIAIEAAQIACGIAPGLLRRFGFEHLIPFVPAVWKTLQGEAQAARRSEPGAPIFGSDVAHRMVDFALRNARRAGVEHALQLRGGDALQRQPPAPSGVMLVNPPYGERITSGGVASPDDFFTQLAAHWKKSYSGWTAWILSPDLKLPSRMRLKESRRIPMWNGPIECRLFRFDLVAGSARRKPSEPAPK